MSARLAEMVAVLPASHLCAGIYQNDMNSCPRSGPGCSVDVENVQVVRP